MKPKDYVKKYDLSSGKGFNHGRFIADFTVDFMTLLETGRKSDGSYTMKGFENTVRAIRQKWDGIHNKTVPGLPEKLWRYFYATVVVKAREEMFPEIMAQRRQRAKEAKERRERMWGRSERRFGDSWSFFFGMFGKKLLSELFAGVQAPKEEFSQLGLTEEASEEDVKSAYKKLVMKHHPDRGGKQEVFVRITEAKNKCLAYLNAA